MNLTEAKVLVVEDDQLMRTFTVNTLKRIGITHLQECADGAAALKMALAFQPHLILTDIHLGVAAYIVKPPRLPDLKNKIEAALNSR